MKDDPRVIKDFIAYGAKRACVYTARSFVKAGATESAEALLARLDLEATGLSPKGKRDLLTRTKPFLFFLRRVDLIVAFYAFRVSDRENFIAFFADNSDFTNTEIEARNLKDFIRLRGEPSATTIQSWLDGQKKRDLSKKEVWRRLKLFKRYAEFIGNPSDLSFQTKPRRTKPRQLRRLEQLRERFGDTPFTIGDAARFFGLSYNQSLQFLTSCPELVCRVGLPEYVLPNGQHFHRETRAFTFVGNEDALSDDWFDSYAPEGCVSVWTPPPRDQITLAPQLPEDCQIRYERVKRQKERGGVFAEALDLGAPGETYVVKRKPQKKYGLPDDGVSDFTGVGLLALRTTKFLAEE